MPHTHIYIYMYTFTRQPIDHPFYLKSKQVAVCGVDILPSELPREASEAFGACGKMLLSILPHTYPPACTTGLPPP